MATSNAFRQLAGGSGTFDFILSSGNDAFVFSLAADDRDAAVADQAAAPDPGTPVGADAAAIDQGDGFTPQADADSTVTLDFGSAWDGFDALAGNPVPRTASIPADWFDPAAPQDFETAFQFDAAPVHASSYVPSLTSLPGGVAKLAEIPVVASTPAPAAQPIGIDSVSVGDAGLVDPGRVDPGAFAVQAAVAPADAFQPEALAAAHHGGPFFALVSGLDSRLAGLYFDGVSQGPANASGKYVTIDVESKDGNGAALLGELETIGLVNGSSFAGLASGDLPIYAIGALAGLSDFSFAREDGAVVGAAAIPPQAAQALAAQHLTETGSHGQIVSITGTGVTVGILSDSFNTSGSADTMQTDIANGYLPANTRILQDSPHGTDEGRAMAELVHEIAPGASILFATAYGGQAGFAHNIIALAQAGAKVIVDDVGYFAEPAYQDGVIAQAINYVTSHYGVTYFSAAGNDGSNGYEAAFNPGIYSSYWGDTFNNFTPGHGTTSYLPVTVPSGDSVVFALEWAQPAASASPGHGATGELDLFLTNTSGYIVGYSLANTVGHDPYQEVDYTNYSASPQTLYLWVGLYSGAAPKDFKLMALDNGGGVKLGTYSSNTDSGTIYGHPAAEGDISTGADFFHNTPAFGVPPVSEYYSSTGPTKLYFNPDGTAMASPLVRPGPAVMAVDGADTSFFGFQINDGDKFPNFFGTSAAAPAAGAVAALMLQADSHLTPSQIESILQTTAVHQNDSVAGLIQAHAAVDAAWHMV